MIPVIAAAAAALAIPIIATPAAADDYDESCYAYEAYNSAIVVGAAGEGAADYASKTKLDPVVMVVTDEKADGHHVGIRLATKQSDGDTRYWAWHENYDGSGTHTKWETYASDSGGIVSLYFQVAIMEGDTIVGYCNTLKFSNSYW
ncbi:hypothetical protein [Streptomyces sp. NBC_01262]|uniref:hypothetical protein n=1 Tax=Streptomyces sp. NBC_01262 TaxID=2903803 RepID=UPI002E381CA9|nr:hypothetical protein [Streptomyces sp. NBC_01262]